MFVAVAEELHFGRAAARLHMAQPPLSQQIRRLEDECKGQLLRRDSRNVALTPYGEVLLGHAKHLLAQQNRMTAELEQARRGEVGKLRIGFVSSAAMSILPDVAKGLRVRWPGIELELREMTTDAQVEALANGELDVGVARDTPADEDIQSVLLKNENLVVVVPMDHHLAGNDAVELRDLAGEGFIAFPRGRASRLAARIESLLNSVKVELVVAQEALQFPTIVGLVAAHLGIAIVPESLRALHIPGVQYLTINDRQATSRLSLIYHSSMAESLTVGHVLDMCQRMIQRLEN